MNLLDSYEKKGTLVEYFQNKPIKDFDVEDIYFYLSQKNMFSPPNLVVKLDLTKNHNLTMIEKFCVV